MYNRSCCRCPRPSSTNSTPVFRRNWFLVQHYSTSNNGPRWSRESPTLAIRSSSPCRSHDQSNRPSVPQAPQQYVNSTVRPSDTFVVPASAEDPNLPAQPLPGTRPSERSSPPHSLPIDLSLL